MSGAHAIARTQWGRLASQLGAALLLAGAEPVATSAISRLRGRAMFASASTT